MPAIFQWIEVAWLNYIDGTDQHTIKLTPITHGHTHVPVVVGEHEVCKIIETKH
jgi:hypothetical protein